VAASKASQQLVSYINVSLECLLNCSPMTVIGKLSSSIFLNNWARGYSTGMHNTIFIASNASVFSALLSLCTLLWIAVNLQQYKCKYRKPQFNY